jgi:hypothetical protein
MSDIDLNLDNYDLPDLLNLFSLDHNFTADDLKRAKKMVLMLHPDKSGLEKDYFLFFTAAYKVVFSIYNFRNSKTKSTTYVVEQDEQKELLLNKLKKHSNFNKVFNDMFDQANIKTEEEEAGYADWLKSDEDLDVRSTTMQAMNETFERKKKEIQALVPMKDLEDSYYTKGTGFELTGDKPEYYSSDVFARLPYEDLKRAHVESVIPVTHDDYLRRQKYKSVDEMRRNASYNDTTPMALDQAKEYLKQRDQMQNKSDMNRAYKLVKQDEVYEQVNKNMMVQFKELCL